MFQPVQCLSPIFEGLRDSLRLWAALLVFSEEHIGLYVNVFGPTELIRSVVHANANANVRLAVLRTPVDARHMAGMIDTKTQPSRC